MLQCILYTHNTFSQIVIIDPLKLILIENLYTQHKYYSRLLYIIYIYLLFIIIYFLNALRRRGLRRSHVVTRKPSHP
nr:MAG TPA: hypothetical protein [Caudoviricetes sp.]